MLKSNFKTAWRQFYNNKAVASINVIGLCLGLTAVLLAFLFIRDEYQFDRFHSKADRIFRINKWVNENNGDRTKNAETPGLMAPALDADFPEVELATRTAPWFNEVLVSYEDQHTFVKNWLFVDSNFFEVFDFKMIRGSDPAKILNVPGQIIVTPALARSLFGGQDPIGKVVTGQNDKLFTIAGLAEPAPRQSHIQYDALVSWPSTDPKSDFLNFNFMNNWLGQTVYTYLLLRTPEQYASVNEKFSDFTVRYMNNRKDNYAFYLQPFKDIYLKSTDLQHLRGGKYGSAVFLRTFSIIALMILLIACFNYVNITTAKSLQRAKEVGIKKVLGVGKKQLIGQFLTETLSLTICAGVLAIGLAIILLPQFNLWFEKDIPLHTIFTVPLMLTFITVIFAASIVAGLFPGWLLTRFKPMSILRNHLKMAPGGEWPRQVLTTLQLSISIGLIAGTLILYQQFSYMLNKDLGFDGDQIIVLNTPPGVEVNHTAFKNELAALPGVQSVSICNAVVEEGTFGSTVIPEGYNGEEMDVRMFRVDTNYLETFGMELAEGRFLGLATDINPGTMVINEAFARQAGWSNPLEQSVQFVGSEQQFPVVGVLKDFHFNSLHQPVSPLLMYLDGRKSHISIRVAPSQISTLLPQIKKLWEKFESRFPFDYQFLDTYFAEKYVLEQQMLKVIALFACLAIFIACLGLYGLAAFAISRRTREIGIRKVLGASVRQIIHMLTFRFVLLVLLAFLMAIPIVYYYADNWLNGFAYHVPLQWSVFVITGLTVLGIVFLTVSFQSVRAALANPVESLKRE